MTKPLRQVIRLNVSGNEQDAFLERLAASSVNTAQSIVNKMDVIQRRVLCDALLTAYVQAIALQSRADKARSLPGFWSYSDDVIHLIESCMQQAGVNITIKTVPAENA